MDMQEGVLLGVCRGCVCSREWIPRQVRGGVDTLARIRVTATREKNKGNCTRPGMDVNS
jgi:NADH-ubiquinone oxidoreductase chain 4